MKAAINEAMLIIILNKCCTNYQNFIGTLKIRYNLLLLSVSLIKLVRDFADCRDLVEDAFFIALIPRWLRLKNLAKVLFQVPQLIVV